MAGRLYAVVGASGVGKDTLIAGVHARRSGLVIAERVITRAGTAGGEGHRGVCDDEFDRMLAAGAFALSWCAHGLRYGIPASIFAVLTEGRDVVFNGSRAALGSARQLQADLTVIHVTAPTEVLAERLRIRGRETAVEIAERLRRAAQFQVEGPDVIEISNGSDLQDTVEAMLGILSPERA